MKKCYSLLRWPCLLQDVLNRRLLFKNKPAAVAPKETIIAHHFFSFGIAEENCRQRNCGYAVVIKITRQTFVNGLLGFII